MEIRKAESGSTGTPEATESLKGLAGFGCWWEMRGGLLLPSCSKELLALGSPPTSPLPAQSQPSLKTPMGQGRQTCETALLSPTGMKLADAWLLTQ